jgi:hypothetical protein
MTRNNGPENFGNTSPPFVSRPFKCATVRTVRMINIIQLLGLFLGYLLTLFNDVRRHKLDEWLWTVNLLCLIMRYYISICVKPRHRQGTVVRFPVQAGDSCFLLSVHTGSSDPKASYSLGTRGAFPGSEVARASRCHSHPSNYSPLFGATHCLWHEFHLFTSHSCRSRTVFSTNLRIHVC